MSIDNKNGFSIIEFSNAHSDIIYAEILFLSRYSDNISLWINKKTHLETKYLTKYARIHKEDFNSLKDRNKFYKDFKADCAENDIKHILLNTAQGAFAREFALKFLFKDYNVTGLLHEAYRFKESFTQKLISLKVRKYFVLNDYIIDYIKRNKINKNCVSTYPVFLPEELLADLKIEPIKQKIKICVPGEVNLKRKDYNFLVDLIIKHKDDFENKVEIQFLGKPFEEKDREVLNKITKAGAEKIFKTYTSHLSEIEYLESIYNCDIIMPMIHPQNEDFKYYKDSKITGAYISVFTFKKPLLLHSSLSDIADFRDISFFYNENNFVEVLTSILYRRDLIKEKSENHKLLTKLDFNYQAKKFYDFMIL